MAESLKSGAGLFIGVDHPQYRVTLEATPQVRDSLLNDLA